VDIRKIALSSLVSFALLMSVSYIPTAKAQDPVSTGIAAASEKMAVGSMPDQVQQTVLTLNSMLTSDLNMNLGNGIIMYQAAVGGLVNSLENERTATVNSLDSERRSALWDAYNMGNNSITSRRRLSMSRYDFADENAIRDRSEAVMSG